jgi:hypothetical protein
LIAINTLTIARVYYFISIYNLIEKTQLNSVINKQ